MSDQFLYVQNQPSTLAGAGGGIGDTTVVLSSFTQIDGTLLTMTNFGSIGFGTIEPGNGIQEEQISFSGITQNANGTATLTGVKSVLMVAPYTQTSGLGTTHAGGTQFVVSNTAGFYDKLTSKNDDETITGTWTFTNPNYPKMDTATPAPTVDEQLATKKYVDTVAVFGAPDASSTTKGISKLSVNPASPTNPIAVGDNDPRFTTAILTATRAGDTASGVQNIAHGLGVTPKKVTVNAKKITLGATAHFAMSDGGFYGTTNACNFMEVFQGDNNFSGTSNTVAIKIYDDDTGNTYQQAVITVDSTNVILTWTKVGTPSANIIQMFLVVQ